MSRHHHRHRHRYHHSTPPQAKPLPFPLYFVHHQSRHIRTIGQRGVEPDGPQLSWSVVVVGAVVAMCCMLYAAGAAGSFNLNRGLMKFLYLYFEHFFLFFEFQQKSNQNLISK